MGERWTEPWVPLHPLPMMPMADMAYHSLPTPMPTADITNQSDTSFPFPFSSAAAVSLSGSGAHLPDGPGVGVEAHRPLWLGGLWGPASSDHFRFCEPWEPGGDVGRVSVGGRDVPPTLEGETRAWKEGAPQGPIRRETRDPASPGPQGQRRLPSLASVMYSVLSVHPGIRAPPGSNPAPQEG